MIAGGMKIIMKILLVEDNDFSIDLLSEMIKDLNYEIIVSKDGEEAVKIIEKSKENEFGLILMDIIMPGMKGTDAAKVIRALDREDVKTIPVIAVTAQSSDIAKQTFKESGINDFVRKPINKSELIKKINVFIENAKKDN